nr:immunoglobulin light chain junction region [Macaca mulatta]MOW36320.1 immunoglobulin light chain junction region [Macaca mulatta]MOW36328.1 immunoglobulin light chain junction region [Macaca mulatta]MOW36368.1 immunoglobulin light chain junction region [Macaca mulatta]MOW36643.1 immunoglobulin light chain junction region [Macaca mulatta]
DYYCMIWHDKGALF